MAGEVAGGSEDLVHGVVQVAPARLAGAERHGGRGEEQGGKDGPEIAGRHGFIPWQDPLFQERYLARPVPAEPAVAGPEILTLPRAGCASAMTPGQPCFG